MAEPFDYAAFADQQADEHGVPRPLVRAIMGIESSGGRNSGYSSAGAVGPMQLMPATAQALGVDRDDPADNIRGGVRLIRQLRDQLGNDDDVAAAYNAGPNRVIAARGDYSKLPRETQGYMSKFQAAYTPGPQAAPDASDPDSWMSDTPPAAAAAHGGPASPAADDPDTWMADAPAAPAGGGASTPRYTQDPRDETVWRGPDGQIAYLGADPNNETPAKELPGGGIEIDIDGSSNPDSIADYLKAHPEMAAPPGTGGLGIAQADEAAKRAMLAKVDHPSWLPKPLQDAGDVLGDVGRSLTAPINDELAGGIAALGQGAYNVAARLRGEPVNVSMGDRFNAAQESERVRQHERDAADPVGTTAGRVAGGLAMLPAGEATVPATIAQVLGTGAAYGAADTDSNDLGKRALGGVVGAGSAAITAGALGVGSALARYAPRLASAIPVVGPLAAKGDDVIAKGVTGLFGKAGDVVGPVVNPILDRAAELMEPRMARAAAEEVKPLPWDKPGTVKTATPQLPPWTPPSDLPPPALPTGTSMEDAQAAGRYVAGLGATAKKDVAQIGAAAEPTVAEAIGKPGLTHAAMLARRPGTTGELADDALLARRDARGGRIMDTLSQAAGIDPVAVNGDFAAHAADLRAKARPLYDAAYDVGSVDSPALQDLARRPSVKAALGKAYRIAREEGADPEALGLVDMEAPRQPREIAPDPTNSPTFKEVLRTLRSGRDPSLNRGPSVIETISRGGGINDAGGEISALDGQDWHKSRPFWNRLVNDGGDSADGWALRLKERGYFPDINGRPSPDDVHGAIADELAGLPRYAQEADPRSVQLKGMADDMEARLNDQGYDHRSMTDDEIAQVLQPVEDGPHPYAPGEMEPVFTTTPSAKSWDYVKRGLDDVLNGYRDKTSGRLVLDEEGRAVKGTLNELRAELINQNPAYGKALAAGGEPLRLEEAFRKAPSLLTDNVPETAFNDVFSRFTPAQQEAFRGGAINHWHTQLRRGQLDLTRMGRGVMQGKLQTMFGPDKAARIADMFAREKGMIAAERAVPPGAGSPTYGLSQAARDADGAQTFAGGLAEDALGSILGSGGHPGVAAGRFSLAAAKRWGSDLGKARGMSEGVRNEAGRLLLMDPSTFKLHMDRLLPGVKIKPRAVHGVFGSGGDEARKRVGWVF